MLLIWSKSRLTLSIANERKCKLRKLKKKNPKNLVSIKSTFIGNLVDVIHSY